MDIKNVDKAEWLSSNRRAVEERIAWLKAQPDGLVHERHSALHRIQILKKEGVVRMFFVDPAAGDAGERSGAMSAMKLQDPFDLSPTPYNQAMMLSLLWQPQPEHVYFAGFAGGRIALIHHHYFPAVHIDCTDIDTDVTEIAQAYFGVAYDARLRLFIEDGRAFLGTPNAAPLYDRIFLDVFRGLGHSPAHLATVEFYRQCKARLKPGGVIAMNMLESDPLFKRRIATLMACFDHIYVQPDRTVVVFASDTKLPGRDGIIARAQALQQEHDFSFAYVDRAASFFPLTAFEQVWNACKEAAPLTDAENGAMSIRFEGKDPLFYGVKAGDPCPCGSGRQFERCHGRK